jgi:hypothetical protein
VACVVQHGKGKVSGIEGDDSYFMLFTFHGGKIVRIESVRTEGEALEAAGLSTYSRTTALDEKQEPGLTALSSL